MKEVLNASEAARILGCKSQKVREMMRRGLWDLGEVISGEELGRERNEYVIWKWKLERLIGRELQ